MDDKVADGVVTVLREVLAEIGREPTHRYASSSKRQSKNPGLVEGTLLSWSG
jgi:hypothetical protein